jgi:Leucine-rich repeat (LRR) protein
LLHYIFKGATRSSRSQIQRTSQSLRVTNVSQQTSALGHSQKEMNDNFLAPPRPPDPTLFIRAGTSGVRHLFPIHLTDNDCNGGLFSRSISRLRSRTPTTELCTNVEMIRNICSSIKTLEHFDVSQNELNDLPLDISLLVDLESLDCSNNQLTDIADLFEQLKHLKELNLSFNHFKHLPNVIYTLKSLIRLNCEHNFITTIDDDLLNLKRLKFFVFDHNLLESIDTIDFGQIKKLEYIHIAHNKLMKFPRGLQLLHHLKNVNLSYNCLTSFPIDLLLVNTLDVLNLSHNLITKLPSMPVAHKRASMIFSIDLSFNQLTKFYDYLLLIALKIDVSNNKIRMISSDLIKKLNNDMMTTRELKINNNPLTQPAIPMEMLNDDSSNTMNVLRMIRKCFDEQQIDVNIRQGFKICLTGCKNSGKTTLANSLEESMPLIIDENDAEKQERIIHG